MGEFFGNIFDAIGALFVIGTIWFWVTSFVLFGLLTWWTEDDKDVLAAITIGVFIWITSSVNDWTLIANPLLWLKWFAVYMVIGATWSFVKWFSFLHKAKDKLRNEIEKFRVGHKPGAEANGRPSEWDGQTFKQFVEQLRGNGFYINDYLVPHHISVTINKPADLIPTVKNRLGDLVRWIIWWPFSLFWTLLNDPIHRLANYIVKAFRGAYTKIASSVFSNEI